MRCLQCGKDLPLLKRMAGSEFCSDAHRREYQQEYSDLALGRLLQSKPPGVENNAGLNGAPSLLTPPPPANGHSAPPLSVTLPAAPKLEPVVAAAKTAPAASSSVAKKTEPRIAIPLPAAPVPAKKVEPDPAVAKAARVDKPAAADVPLLIPRTLAFVEARAQRPGAPSHEAMVAMGTLLEANPLPLGRGVEIADVSIHAIERELELRELARPVPRVQLDVRITGPQALDVQREALAIQAMPSIAPEDAPLWTAERREFAGSLISLGSLAGYGLSTTGFEEPGIEAPAPMAAEAAALTIPVDTPVVEPEPRVAPPRFLALSPAAAPVPAPEPAAPVSVSVDADLGLPELRLESGRNVGASHMPKIVAAVAGAAALGLGIFFFLGRGETRPKPAAETTTTSANWISNFATDAKNQRRVSVLRASLGLSAYRLDFESSIQIKGLGWVYRAQDAKNYYVSKIELEKPGQNPEFAIVHYAVIDGVEQAHEQTPLHVGVPLGGHYKIRFEAVDDRFTTWVQGQQVEQWMDGRLKSGGAGLYREGAEQFTLHGDFQVTPLAK